MLRSLRHAAPLCLLLAALPAHTPPDAKATSLAPPSTMRGVLRYKVRGLSAVQGGFLSGAIMGVATGVGMQTAAGNVLKLLGGVAKLSGNAGLAEMNTFLRTGKGFDFSRAPVSAGYNVELDFVLESDAKGNWHLKSGDARYFGDTHADLTLSGAKGNTHRFTDRFRGMGSAKLTPQNATITLTYEGKGKNRRANFDVDVKFPVKVYGKTIWSAMGGAAVITREDKGDMAIASLDFLGQHYSDNESNSAWYAGVTYGRSGPVQSVYPRARETWQNLTDSGEMVKYELWTECTAEMVNPKLKDELVYDTLTPGRILRYARAEVKPLFFNDDLEWEFHQILGSQLEYYEYDESKPRPERSKGNLFEVHYDTLPSQNSSFAFWDVTTKFVTEEARRAGCKDPKPRRVGYYFARDATNHSGPSTPVDAAAKLNGPTPNWFHYWRQTKAAQGVAPYTLYGAGSPTCSIPGVGGYYTPGASHVVVCDLGKAWNHYLSHPLLDLEFHGIDTYASVVRHEWTHYEDYLKWWKGKGPLPDNEVCEDKEGEIVKQKIGDGIPDGVEPSVKIPPLLNSEYTFFDNTVCDTPGQGFGDEHYIAWMAMADWPMGSANTEDWACPGKQTSGNCK